MVFYDEIVCIQLKKMCFLTCLSNIFIFDDLDYKPYDKITKLKKYSFL